MGVALITLKVMPIGVDVDFNSIKKSGEERVIESGGEITKTEEQPIAFGLKALMVFIRTPEDKDTDLFENAFKDIEGVSSVEIVDYRRAIE